MGELLNQRLAKMAEDIDKPMDSKSSEKFETEMNKYEVNIDKECVKLLALHKPSASDLRFIISTSRVVNDLESIADEILRFNEAKESLIKNLGKKEEPTFSDINQIILNMDELLKEVMFAYDHKDAEKAAKVIIKERDMEERILDAIRTRIVKIIEEPSSVKSIVHSFWILRSLERIGKCIRQVGNHVLYMLEGNDTRHKSREHLRDRFLNK